MLPLRGDPVKLVNEYAKNFCLRDAMCAAGYRGAGRIYEAVRDIEEHAHILRRVIGGGGDGSREDRERRILREYERIAFAGDDEGIRISDKLKALEMYRILSGGAASAESSVIINYDYGDRE